MKSSDVTLERFNALEARVAALEGRSAPRPAPKLMPEDEGVRITHPLPATMFVMPLEADLRRLLSIVGARFPNLRPKFSGPRVEADEIEYFRQFGAAFRALGHMRRADALDRKHAATFWADSAEDLLRAQGASESVSVGPLTTALIAHGDIMFSDVARFPYDLEFGLCVGGAGRPARDAWRRVLATGQAPAPVAVAQSRNYPTPPVDIRVVG
jgi:hypothetical protein